MNRDNLKVNERFRITPEAIFIFSALQDFTMDFYFRQHWKDPRLKFSGPKGLGYMQVSSDFTAQIWLPDTFFPNEKRAYYHKATTDNEMIRIHSDGNILRSMR